MFSMWHLAYTAQLSCLPHQHIETLEGQNSKGKSPLTRDLLLGSVNQIMAIKSWKGNFPG